MKAMRIRVLVLLLSVVGFAPLSSAQHHRKIFTPAGHTFTDVNGTNFTCSTSPCTITYTATAGHLLVITFGNQLGSDYITAVSGGGTWTIPSGCQVTDTGTSESCAYIISNTGATSFSLSFTTNSATASGTLFEWSYTGTGSVVLDGSAASASNASATSQTLITPTITSSSDLVVQGVETHTGTTVTSTITQSYIDDESGGTRGQFHLTNTTNTTAPVLTLSGSAHLQICEVAFK